MLDGKDGHIYAACEPALLKLNRMQLAISLRNGPYISWKAAIVYGRLHGEAARPLVLRPRI